MADSSSNFAAYQLALMPGWLAGKFGAAYAQGLGIEKDTLAKLIKNGVGFRFPVYPARPWLTGKNAAYFGSPAVCVPTAPNGFMFKITAGAGNTGASEPVWPTTIGGTVTDSGLTWTNTGPQFVTPGDALDAIGKDRLIPRPTFGTNNTGALTDFDYAALLRAAFATWDGSGTANGVGTGIVPGTLAGFQIWGQNGTRWQSGTAAPSAVYGPPSTSPPVSAPAGTPFYFDADSPMSFPTTWAASTVYAPQAIVTTYPTQNGFVYYTQTGGTSGSTQPAFPTPAVPIVGTPPSVLDGTVRWVTQYNYWSRFIIIIPVATSGNIAAIRALVAQWKDAESTCLGYVVVNTGVIWGGGWAWGDGTNWGGTTTVYPP